LIRFLEKLRGREKTTMISNWLMKSRKKKRTGEGNWNLTPQQVLR